MNNKNSLLIFCIIVLAVFSRLFISIPNFSAIGALALFCGAIASRKLVSIMIPFASLLAGDLILSMTGQMYSDYFADGYFIYVYAAFGLTWFIGRSVKNRISAGRIASASILSSLSFFLITNFGSWLQLPYAKNLYGLGRSYLAGLVFYKGDPLSNFFLNGLVGDIFFNGLFFGAYFGIAYLISRNLKSVKISS